MKKLLFLGFCLPFCLFSQAVQFTSPCGAQTFCFNQNGCGAGPIEFTAAAAGGCGALVFSWELDLGNNGSFEKSGAGATISEAVSTAGPHRVVFKAKDNCGGAANCTLLFSGKDCQPPVVLLNGGLSLSLQQPDCKAVIDPKLFVSSASDNCTPTSQIQYAIRKKGDGTGFPTTATLTVPACETGTVLVEIWSKDLAGNAGQSNSYAIVQTGAGGCQCPQDTILFAGKLTSMNDLPAFASSFSPTISGGTAGFPASLTPVVIDTATGGFSFRAIARQSPTKYTIRIEPKKVFFPTNGLSSLDLVLISKHILGSGPFDSVYKMVAGDVNLDGAVSTADIVEARKVILGVFFDFQTNASWRIVEEAADPSDLTQLPNLKSVKTLQFTVQQGQPVPDFLNLNFKAIKIGDPNGSADPKI